MPEHHPDDKALLLKIIGLLAALASLGCVFFFHTAPHLSPAIQAIVPPPTVPPIPQSPALPPHDGRLYSPSTDAVLVFGTKEDALEMITRRNDKVDMTDTEQMRHIGEIVDRSLRPKNGALVLILDRNDDPDITEVRVVDGKYKDREGWLRTDFIQRSF